MKFYEHKMTLAVAALIGMAAFSIAQQDGGEIIVPGGSGVVVGPDGFTPLNPNEIPTDLLNATSDGTKNDMNGGGYGGGGGNGGGTPNGPANFVNSIEN